MKVIKIREYQFDPNVVHIVPGEEIIWIHENGKHVRHSINSNEFESTILSHGQRYSRYFYVPESIEYYW